MRDFLYEKISKNKIVDEVNKKINETIDAFIDYDYLCYVFPVLSKMELKKDSNFFKVNQITINQEINFTSAELKTLSYLAPFFKEKIKYNPKEIVRYLNFLGYKASKNDIIIGCLNISNEYTDNIKNYISYEDYLKLPDLTTISSKISTKSWKRYNGFDYGFDAIAMR